MESLLHFDNLLLLGLNGLVGNTILDNSMIFLSKKWVWLPLYGVILFAFVKRFGWLNASWICLAAACMVVLTDQGSVRFFKEVFQRLRPCHNVEIQAQLTLLSGKCGGQFGFISSHAANVFGLSMFVTGIMRNNGWYLLFLWAALVSISRVYLGVHYPSDILIGAIFGAIIGYLFAKITSNIIQIE